MGSNQVEVPICIDDKLYKSYWESEIKHAISSINLAVPGLYLYLSKDSYAIKISITDEDEYRAFTRGNIISQRKVLISLGKNFTESKEQRHSTATHEMLHALGIKHELQRRDAGGFASYPRSDKQVFPKLDYYGITAFDPNSIMMYPECEETFSRKDEAYIWTLKPGRERQSEMSEPDKVGLNMLHKPVPTASYKPRRNGPGKIYYCGRNFIQQDDSSGTCIGSNGGPTCPACRVLKSEALLKLVKNNKWQGWSGLVYCGKKFCEPHDLGNGWSHDGYCGPNNGPQCHDCKTYAF